MRTVGLLLSRHLDSFVKTKNPHYEHQIETSLHESNKNVGRLLHYFPIEGSAASKDDNWCGWHNDHGTLTGLCSAMFLSPDYEEVKI